MHPRLPMQESFQYQIFFETQTGSPTSFFGIARQEKIEKLVMQPRLLCKKRFKTDFFSNTEGFSYKIFRHCEMKKIENPVRHPPSPMQDKIQYRVFSRTQKGSHAKFFGIARQKHRKTREAPPVSYAGKDSKPGFFSNTEGFPYKIYWPSETIKFPCKTLLIYIFFPYPNVSETTRVPPTIFFGTVRQKTIKNP